MTTTKIPIRRNTTTPTMIDAISNMAIWSLLSDSVESVADGRGLGEVVGGCETVGTFVGITATVLITCVGAGCETVGTLVGTSAVSMATVLIT